MSDATPQILDDMENVIQTLPITDLPTLNSYLTWADSIFEDSENRFMALEDSSPDLIEWAGSLMEENVYRISRLKEAFTNRYLDHLGG